MSNGFEKAERFVKEIERHHETLASYAGEHLQRCKSVREMISSAYDLAKDAGIPKRELRAVVKERALLKKIEALREGLEDEQAETFDQIKHALGMLSDLPLGEATLARSEAIDSLTEDEEADPDEEAAAANSAALRAGIRAVN
ncbi:hypothetical protein OIU35_31760 [Boseaceae bacterium BT-24-1]|nr:hypothetical protein [Boseaceae bacterium BT-24-1]